MKKIIFLALIIATIIFSCSKSNDAKSSTSSDNSLDCTGVAKSFSSDVNTIIQTTCATNSGCHGSGSSNGPGPLLTYSEIFNARSLIRSAVASGEMPLGGSLSTNNKNTILCWIDSGAPSN